MYRASNSIALLLFCASSGWSAEKIVRISTLCDYPPFCFKEDSAPDVIDDVVPPGKDAQSLKGYSWDVVRESFHAVGYTIHMTIVPWARGMRYTEHGKVDLMFPATKTQERLRKFHYSKCPTDKQQFVIYVQRSSNLKWDGLESLKGLDIGTMSGWSFGEKFDKVDYINRKPSTEILLGLRELAKGRLDGVVGYEVAYDYELKRAGISHKFKKFPSFDHTEEFMIGSRKHSRARELLEEFDRGKRTIMQNGVLDQIDKKWLAN